MVQWWDKISFPQKKLVVFLLFPFNVTSGFHGFPQDFGQEFPCRFSNHPKSFREDHIKRSPLRLSKIPHPGKSIGMHHFTARVLEATGHLGKPPGDHRWDCIIASPLWFVNHCTFSGENLCFCWQKVRSQFFGTSIPMLCYCISHFSCWSPTWWWLDKSQVFAGAVSKFLMIKWGVQLKKKKLGGPKNYWLPHIKDGEPPLLLGCFGPLYPLI